MKVVHIIRYLMCLGQGHCLFWGEQHINLEVLFSGIKIYGICTNLQWNLMQLVSKINAERKWKCSWRRCPIVARILYFLHLLKGQAKVIDVIITALIVIIIHVISVNRFVSMWKDICAMVALIFLNGGIFFWADFLNREICCVFSRHFLIAKKKEKRDEKIAIFAKRKGQKEVREKWMSK